MTHPVRIRLIAATAILGAVACAPACARLLGGSGGLGGGLTGAIGGAGGMVSGTLNSAGNLGANGSGPLSSATGSLSNSISGSGSGHASKSVDTHSGSASADAGLAGTVSRSTDAALGANGLAGNLSDTGISMSALSLLAPPPGLVVGLEMELPGVADSIWASGQICYRKDDRLASGLGIRFLAMARSQARTVRDFCIELRRQNLGTILARIRA